MERLWQRPCARKTFVRLRKMLRLQKLPGANRSGRRKDVRGHMSNGSRIQPRVADCLAWFKSVFWGRPERRRASVGVTRRAIVFPRHHGLRPPWRLTRGHVWSALSKRKRRFQCRMRCARRVSEMCANQLRRRRIRTVRSVSLRTPRRCSTQNDAKRQPAIDHIADHGAWQDF